MMLELESFNDVLSSIKRNKGREFHLLLGNGFSMAYNPEIFSYGALQNFVREAKNDVLTKLFSVLKNNNFELLLQNLETFEAFIDAFGADKALKKNVYIARKELKSALINAIRSLHPGHVFEVSQESCDACAEFLKVFKSTGGHIFTTNYDLLLYWVLMRSEVLNSVDGFGRELTNLDEVEIGEDPEFSELRWGKYREDQNVHYLHGTLPFFDTGVEIVKEVYDSEGLLLVNISERVENGDYPIFVTAGTAHEKLTQIMHNRYLTFCYEKLAAIEGSLVTFGFNFGKYDDHIIEAINTAAKFGKKASSKLWSIYIGVYSEADQKYIEAILHKFKCKIHIFDAKTADVWGTA